MHCVTIEKHPALQTYDPSVMQTDPTGGGSIFPYATAPITSEAIPTS
jgi:hypothetical protein